MHFALSTFRFAPAPHWKPFHVKSDNIFENVFSCSCSTFCAKVTHCFAITIALPRSILGIIFRNIILAKIVLYHMTAYVCLKAWSLFSSKTWQFDFLQKGYVIWYRRKHIMFCVENFPRFDDKFYKSIQCMYWVHLAVSKTDDVLKNVSMRAVSVP